ncbi:MAG: calcium/sodium antiporter [Lachnospiraceae bacterium]|nr:calcium/sodium antiporter [Lachnospiraceae bacterium]
MLILDIILLVAGFVALIKGADWFVDGSASIARILKVPGVIVGLTIVAMGTSAPELAVSTSAALSGSNEIALSNVIGSNMFNLLMVLGVCAIICKVPVEDVILKRDFPINILVTVFALICVGRQTLTGRLWQSSAMSDEVGDVTRLAGILLLVIFVCYVIYLVIDAIKHPVASENEGEKILPVWKCILLILVGIALIVGGGQAVVNSAKEIARIAGMSETLIGLTIVALGTSLPELVTSVVAAKKGETGMAVGNVVGSNLFNLMLILGVSSAIHPIGVNLASVCDLVILLVITVITYLFCFVDRSVKRVEGVVMVLMYVTAMVFAALR